MYIVAVYSPVNKNPQFFRQRSTGKKPSLPRDGAQKMAKQISNMRNLGSQEFLKTPDAGMSGLVVYEFSVMKSQCTGKCGIRNLHQSLCPVHTVKLIPVFFSSMTTKTKIFVDENKLIFVTKTTTTTKIRQFSSTKRKLKLKFNLLMKTTTKISLFSSTRRKFLSRILAQKSA